LNCSGQELNKEIKKRGTDRVTGRVSKLKTFQQKYFGSRRFSQK
jgi:hypothetical protein